MMFPLYLAALVLAVTLHEVAHGYAAFYAGDGTAWFEGRLSLNPARHMEWIGTVLVPVCSLIAVGMPVGWARPMPVTFAFITRLQAIGVALAGPACNAAQAGAWWAARALTDEGTTLHALCTYGVTINVALIVVNALPLLPFDGGRVLHSLLPPRQAAAMVRWLPWGYPALAVWVAGWLLALHIYRYPGPPL